MSQTCGTFAPENRIALSTLSLSRLYLSSVDFLPGGIPEYMTFHSWGFLKPTWCGFSLSTRELTAPEYYKSISCFPVVSVPSSWSFNSNFILCRSYEGVWGAINVSSFVKPSDSLAALIDAVNAHDGRGTVSVQFGADDTPYLIEVDWIHGIITIYEYLNKSFKLVKCLDNLPIKGSVSIHSMLNGKLWLSVGNQICSINVNSFEFDVIPDIIVNKSLPNSPVSLQNFTVLESSEIFYLNNGKLFNKNFEIFLPNLNFISIYSPKTENSEILILIGINENKKLNLNFFSVIPKTIIHSIELSIHSYSSSIVSVITDEERNTIILSKSKIINGVEVRKIPPKIC
jgi:hypothetical protein